MADSPPECIRRGCTKRVAFVAIVPYDGDYLRCADHIDEALKVAGTFANRLTDGGRKVTWEQYVKIKQARDNRGI